LEEEAQDLIKKYKNQKPLLGFSDRIWGNILTALWTHHHNDLYLASTHLTNFRILQISAKARYLYFLVGPKIKDCRMKCTKMHFL
jgi:hypothetical protein